MGSPLRREEHETAAAMTTMLLTHSLDLSNLWKLEALCITDPAEKKMREEMETTTLDYFKKALIVDEEGRYEIQLLWTDQEEL